MNCINVDIYTKQYSNFEGLIECKYSQYPLDLYPPITVETPRWTELTWPYIKKGILIVRALLNVNILNIHWICILNFPLNLEYEM
jgi:hypothetical protein